MRASLFLILVNFLGFQANGEQTLIQRVESQAREFCRRNIVDSDLQAHNENCALIKELLVAPHSEKIVDANGRVSQFPLAQLFRAEGERNKQSYSQTFPDGSAKDIFDHSCRILIRPPAVAFRMGQECQNFCQQQKIVEGFDCLTDCRQAIFQVIDQMSSLHLHFHRTNQACQSESGQGPDASGTAAPN